MQEGRLSALEENKSRGFFDLDDLPLNDVPRDPLEGLGIPGLTEAPGFQP